MPSPAATLIGHNAIATGTNSIACTSPMSSGTSQGDTLMAWVTSNGNAPNGVSDPVNGAYTQVGSSVVNGALMGSWWVFQNAAPLSTTQVPSASFPGTSGAKTIELHDCTGVSAASVDSGATAQATGTSTAPSVTSGALAQAVELVLAGLVAGNAAGAPAWTAPLSGLGADHLAGQQQAATAGEVTSSAGAVTAAGTIVSAAWGVAVIALKALVTGSGGVTLPKISVAGLGTVTPPPLLAPPMPPLFPDGYGPQPPDFTTWVQDTLGFLTTGVVFRAHQAVPGGQALAAGYTTIAYDTIDEDPNGGWSAVATSAQPANSWLVPWTGTYTVTVCVSCLAAAIWLGGAVLISGGTPMAGEAALTPSGTYGGGLATWTQALVGGVDYIQGQAACSAAATTDTTSPGRCPVMEISYTSE